jgi:hypothetical protein
MPADRLYRHLGQLTGGPQIAQLDPSAPEPKYLGVPEEETTHGPWV